MSNKLLFVLIILSGCVDSTVSVDAMPPLDATERHLDSRAVVDARLPDAENLKACNVTCPGEKIWPEQGPFPHMVCLPSYTYCEIQPSCSTCPGGSVVTCDGNQCSCEGMLCYGST